MRWLGLTIGVALSAGAGRLPGAIFHPELLRLGDRPTLIDCEHGFRPALLTYFGEHARKDGVPVGPVSLAALPRDSDRWVSRFEVVVGDRRYRGLVYLEPPLGDDDDETGPPAPPRLGQRDCSAAFAEEPLTPESAAALEVAYRDLCAHFGVPP